MIFELLPSLNFELLNFNLWIEYFILVECGIFFSMFLKDQFEKPHFNDSKFHLGTAGQPVLGFFASILFQAAGIPLYEAMGWSTGLFTTANLTPRLIEKIGGWLDAKRESSLEDRDVRLVKCLGKMMNIDEDQLTCILKEAGLVESGKAQDEKIGVDELAKAAEALTHRDEDGDCPFKEPVVEDILDEAIAETPIEAES